MSLGGRAYNVVIIDGSVDATVLTAVQCKNGLMSNVGQGAHDVTVTLPAPVADLFVRAVVGEPSANYWRVAAPVAASMIVDGVYAKGYAALATPGLGNFIDFFTMRSVPQPVGLLTASVLAIGSTPENVATTAFNFYVAGVKYAKTAVAAGTAPGASVIPMGTFGAVALDIGVNGTIDAVDAADNATGYDTAALAVAGLPAVASGHVRIGYVTAKKSDGDFTFGTTSLAAANTTVAYTANPAYTPTYTWVAQGGRGTVTSA